MKYLRVYVLKKSVLKLLEFTIWKILLVFLSNKRMEEAFNNISMYLYNKNALEYAQIARSGPKSMISNIEGRSNR